MILQAPSGTDADLVEKTVVVLLPPKVLDEEDAGHVSKGMLPKLRMKRKRSHPRR
jgi:hypothetical protein